MWARIDNGRVAEVIGEDPAGRFHPSIEWFPCGNAVRQGMLFSGGEFVEYVPPQEAITNNERAWRNAELARADNQIRMHEDGDSTASATEAEWRSYRNALRAWPQCENFPEIGFRPAAPAPEAA